MLNSDQKKSVEEGGGGLAYMSTVLASDWVKHNFAVSRSPFLQDSVTARLLRWSTEELILLLEKLVGTKFHICITTPELYDINPRAKYLLGRLIAEGVISDWFKTPRSPCAPLLPQWSLVLAPTRFENGIEKTLLGGTCTGVGHSYSQALIPALGEAIERHALCTWSGNSTVHLSQGEATIRSFISEYSWIERGEVMEDVLRNHQIHVVDGKDFVSGAVVEVPAQQTYINFDVAHLGEYVFGQSTSNGAAAGDTLASASLRAVLELIERDAFLLHWFHKITPIQIDVDSIESNEIMTLVTDARQWGYEIALCVMKSDVKVPVVFGIVYHKLTGSVIGITAGAGLDIEEVVRKNVYDVVRWLHDSFSKMQEPFKNVTTIQNFQQRRGYWMKEGALTKCSWLLSGSKVSLAGLVQDYAHLARMSVSEGLEFLRTEFGRNAVRCVIVDITSRLARESGLFVVKAVSPDLVPIYFNEQRKPLARKRIFSWPHRMGFRKVPAQKDDLNPEPHPFI